MLDSTDILLVGLIAKQNPFLVTLEVSPFAVIAFVAIAMAVLLLRKSFKRRHKVVEMEISIGLIGKVKIQPKIEDIQIAHKIWTQLVTRKVAIRIDPDKDVIIEVYNSWYALFAHTRELISNIPAVTLKNEKSTQQLVDIATAVLNEGLRPHLTHWQARYRNWHEVHKSDLNNLTPQEYQKTFPEYKELIADMAIVNRNMIEYAEALKKIINA